MNRWQTDNQLLICLTCGRYHVGLEVCTDCKVPLVPMREPWQENLELLSNNPKLAHYTVQYLIAQSKHSYLVLLHVHGSDRAFVLKLFRDKLTEYTRDRARRFEQASERTSRLKHPNIASLVHWDQLEDGRPFQIIEYVDGISLAEIIVRDGFLDHSLFHDVFTQVCDALDHAHQQGIFHGDLTPGDIMIVAAPDGSISVKLLDFGKGYPLLHGDNLMQQRTEACDFFGNPRYMCPDIEKQQLIDAATNVYSLGCIMHEALVGKPLIEDNGWLHILAAHMQRAPVPLAPLMPNRPWLNQIEPVIHQALWRNRSIRYRSMADLKAAILAVPRPA